MSNHRCERISEEIKRELSQIIRDDIKDPRVRGLISITAVEVTNDLRYARIYVSMLASPEQSKSALQGLEKAGGYLRTELAKRLQIRYTPELIFKLDQSIEYGTKINKIIAGFNQNKGDEGSDV